MTNIEQSTEQIPQNQRKDKSPDQRTQAEYNQYITDRSESIKDPETKQQQIDAGKKLYQDLKAQNNPDMMTVAIQLLQELPYPVSSLMNDNFIINYLQKQEGKNNLGKMNKVFNDNNQKVIGQLKSYFETTYFENFSSSISTPVPFTAPTLTAADLKTMSADQIAKAKDLPFLTDQQLDKIGISPEKDKDKYQKYQEAMDNDKLDKEIEAKKEKIEDTKKSQTDTISKHDLDIASASDLDISPDDDAETTQTKKAKQQALAESLGYDSPDELHDIIENSQYADTDLTTGQLLSFLQTKQALANNNITTDPFLSDFAQSRNLKF